MKMVARRSHCPMRRKKRLMIMSMLMRLRTMPMTPMRRVFGLTLVTRVELLASTKTENKKEWISLEVI
jgi:hypothetical protein